MPSDSKEPTLRANCRRSSVEKEKRMALIQVLSSGASSAWGCFIGTLRATLRKYYENPYFALEFMAGIGAAIIVISYLLSRWLPFTATFIILSMLIAPWLLTIGFALQFQQFKQMGIWGGKWSDRLEAWSKQHMVGNRRQ